MEDIENLSEEDRRHYMMNAFHEQYPVALELLHKMSINTHLKIEAEELVAIVRGLSIACVEYQNYIENHFIDRTELH